MSTPNLSPFRGGRGRKSTNPMEPASKLNNYHYNKKLKGFARANRKSLTKSAASTWKYLLSNRQMKGYQFKRERPILNYIADFVCLDLLLIIEIDGITHDSEEAIIKDEKRDKALEEVGFTVLRFSSWEVLNKMVDVAIIIGDWIDENAICPPSSRLRERKSR